MHLAETEAETAATADFSFGSFGVCGLRVSKLGSLINTETGKGLMKREREIEFTFNRIEEGTVVLCCVHLPAYLSILGHSGLIQFTSFLLLLLLVKKQKKIKGPFEDIASCSIRTLKARKRQNVHQSVSCPARSSRTRLQVSHLVRAMIWMASNNNNSRRGRGRTIIITTIIVGDWLKS